LSIVTDRSSANGTIVLLTTLLSIYLVAQNRKAERGLAVIEKLVGFRYTI